MAFTAEAEVGTRSKYGSVTVEERGRKQCGAQRVSRVITCTAT